MVLNIHSLCNIYNVYLKFYFVLKFLSFWQEGQMALECLKKNMYNKAKCSLEFENTRACKKFWVSSRNILLGDCFIPLTLPFITMLVTVLKIFRFFMYHVYLCSRSDMFGPVIDEHFIITFNNLFSLLAKISLKNNASYC